MHKEEIVISNISYLNTLPFRFGIDHYNFPSQFSIKHLLNTPAECANNLKNGNAQIGIIPVAALPEIKNSTIISNYCIASLSFVRSVILFSQVPLNQIKRIYLDYQSRTSVKLIQYLANKKWNIHPEFIDAYPGYELKISETTAGLVIGDRALQMENQFLYQWDLAEEWYEYTNLPFVFAVWVCNSPINDIFFEHFNNALKLGIENTDKAIAQLKPTHNFDYEYINKYLKENIYYHYNAQTQAAVKYFINNALI